MMDTPSSWSVNALAAELGLDRRTLARRIEGLAPVGQSPRGDPLFRLVDVLAAIERSPVQRVPRVGDRTASAASAATVERLLLERGGPAATLTGEDLCRMYGWQWPDLAELLGFGAPAVRCGSRTSERGWVFCFPSLARYIGLLAGALDLEADASLAAGLRRLRGARPLFVPVGFRDFTEPKRARGER